MQNEQTPAAGLITFERAKVPHPVDDPKALVPFGWAPGEYICLKCGDCGEPHSESDKRSSVCQDCAEARRDRAAVASPASSSSVVQGDASGVERDDEPTEAMIQAGLKVDFDNEDERATIINVWQAMIASRPQPTAAPVSRPGDGVEGGGYDRTDVRHGLHLIANEECDEVAASYYAKKALSHLAVLTPPAEPVSRPAGEGEREAGDYTMALAERQAFEDHTDLAAHIERMATTGRIGSMIEWDGFLRSLNVALQPGGER